MFFEGGEVCQAKFFACRIWNVFAYRFTHISAIVKWIVPCDSVYQIGPVSTPHNLFNSSGDGLWGVEVYWAEFWKSKFLSCFHIWSHNQWCYDKMEATIGFSTSNRSRNYLPRYSDCRWWWYLRGVKFVGRNFLYLRVSCVSLIAPQPWIWKTNGDCCWIQHVK